MDASERAERPEPELRKEEQASSTNSAESRPVEENSPAQQSLPVEESRSAQESRPVKESRPVEESGLVDEKLPVKEKSPLHEESRPLQQNRPVDENRTQSLPKQHPEDAVELEQRGPREEGPASDEYSSSTEPPEVPPGNWRPWHQAPLPPAPAALRVFWLADIIVGPNKEHGR